MRSHFRSRVPHAFVVLFLLSRMASASEYRGRVSFGGIPVPGATVTVSQGTTTDSTLTDSQGYYFFPDLADGTCKLSVQLFGFEPLQQDVIVSRAALPATSELKMLPLEQLLTEAKAVQAAPHGPELQTHAVTADAKQVAPPPAEISPEAQHRAEDANDGLLINGSQSNAATSKFTLDPAFGNRRAGSKSLYTGGIGLHEENAALDARPYSITGLEVPKAQFNLFNGVLTLG